MQTNQNDFSDLFCTNQYNTNLYNSEASASRMQPPNTLVSVLLEMSTVWDYTCIKVIPGFNLTC